MRRLINVITWMGLALLIAGISALGVVGSILCAIGAVLSIAGLSVDWLRTRTKDSRPSESEDYNPYDPYDRHNPDRLNGPRGNRYQATLDDDIDDDFDDLLKLDD